MKEKALAQTVKALKAEPQYELIADFSIWVLEADETQGLEIFTRRAPAQEGQKDLDPWEVRTDDAFCSC